jgi:hypothetical protein
MQPDSALLNQGIAWRSQIIACNKDFRMMPASWRRRCR